MGKKPQSPPSFKNMLEHTTSYDEFAAVVGTVLRSEMLEGGGGLNKVTRLLTSGF